VAKYNAAGIRQWYRQIGTDKTEYPRDIELDAAGNIYITGTTTGQFTASPTSTHVKILS